MTSRTNAAVAANDNSADGDFAFAIGEDVEVMTRGVIVEQARNENGRSYVVRAEKNGREIFIRAAELDVYEAEPVKVADVRAAA